MKHTFELTKKAEQLFAALSKDVQKRIVKKLEFYEQQETPLQFSKKIKRRKNTFRFRIGAYRLIITPKENGEFVVLLVIHIGHCREVYTQDW